MYVCEYHRVILIIFETNICPRSLAHFVLLFIIKIIGQDFVDIQYFCEYLRVILMNGTYEGLQAVQLIQKLLFIRIENVN